MNRIAERRKELQLTQKQLAEMLKLTRSHLNKSENEKKKVNVMLAIRIAQALDTTVERLFSDEC
ncbi:helix-turn-helix transcriptional regulator [Rossellomorea aquimaris]|uniref:helix-turn-helix transcriptional regulator n=1 Tax=Rossellomorea aquimaris TaxID=189382 RepID=UPI0011E948E7|nr:helix-turn-helix transcriptional regulator [Rossellomorea aquimaris]TYS91947.1 helix-turn-helix transcriptional regulator [Rossellomorea aquimaris]